MRDKRLGVEWKQVVGGASDEVWSQVRWESGGDKGRAMLVVMSLEEVMNGEEGVKEKGRGLMEEVVESFVLGEKEGWEWVVEQVDRLRGEIGDIGSVVVGQVLVDDEGKRGVYIGGWGGMKVVLVRGGERVEVWGGGEAVSGWLLEEDELVIGSEEFVNGIWSEGASEVEMVAKMGEMEDGAKVAGLVVKVKRIKLVEEVIDNEQEGIIELVESDISGIEPSKTRVMVVNEEPGWKRGLARLKRKLGLGGRGIVLRSEESGKRRWAMVLGSVFLVIFLVSVVVGAGRRSVMKEREEFEGVSEPIEYALEEAVRLKSVNAVRSRSLVMEAKEEIVSQGDRFAEGRLSEEWTELAKRVDEVWREVSGEVRTEGQVWLDAGVFKEGLKMEGVDVRDEWLYLWGEDERVVVRVSLNDKSGEVVAGGESLSGVVDIAGADEEILALNGSDVVVVSEEGEETARLDMEGVVGRLVEGYGINAYVVAGDDLFRFPGTGEGYGKRRRFLSPGVVVDMNGVVDMAIDGEVWLLVSNGEVVRLNQGLVVDYELKPVEEWQKPEKIIVSEERGRVWVWDTEMGAVVEFDRESGDYLQKLVWEGFGRAGGVDFDEERGRLMVIIEGEVWVVGI